MQWFDFSLAGLYHQGSRVSLPSNFHYGDQRPTYVDHAYRGDDETYHQYIIKLPSLRRLTLFNAPTPVFCLRAAAARCTCLRHLSMTFNVLSNRYSKPATAHEVEGMAAALSHLTTLESLHLAGLGQHSGELLLPALTGHLTRLRALRLVWKSDEVPQQISLLRRVGL